MLLAASESAVTKKPRLRLMMRRSSSVRPFGSRQVAMSRDMLISCGIQWLAHVARYFSHAHLYLNGTSWLTSVWPLMMRFSATLTRRLLRACAPATGTAGLKGSGETCGSAARIVCSCGEERAATRTASEWECAGLLGVIVDVGRMSSSQTSM